jgi:hypothetical protein
MLCDNESAVCVHRHKWRPDPTATPVSHWIWLLVFSSPLSGGIVSPAFMLAHLRSQKEAIGRQAVEEEK